MAIKNVEKVEVLPAQHNDTYQLRLRGATPSTSHQQSARADCALVLCIFDGVHCTALRGRVTSLVLSPALEACALALRRNSFARDWDSWLSGASTCNALSCNVMQCIFADAQGPPDVAGAAACP
jgi:hypothetical protein